MGDLFALSTVSCSGHRHQRATGGLSQHLGAAPTLLQGTCGCLQGARRHAAALKTASTALSGGCCTHSSALELEGWMDAGEWMEWKLHDGVAGVGDVTSKGEGGLNQRWKESS